MKLLKFFVSSVILVMALTLSAHDYKFSILKFDSAWSDLYYTVTLKYSGNVLEVYTMNGIIGGYTKTEDVINAKIGTVTIADDGLITFHNDIGEGISGQ